MKKHITLMLLIVSFTSAFAQYAVRNYSFENWIPNGVHPWPDKWEAYDSTTTAQFGLLEKRTGGSDGNYSVRMNAYQDGPFVTGAWLEMSDTFPFNPKAFSLDYIIPPASSFLCTIRINLYIYDSAGDVIISPSYNMTATSTGFKNFVTELSFPTRPKSYAMDIKFQNINGDPEEYVVVDNVRFLENYTPPPPPPPTGIAELNQPLFNMYPNPSSGTLYFKNLPLDASNWKIIGADGREVQQSIKGNLDAGLDIHSVNAGIYIVELYNSEGVLLGRNRFCKAE